MTLPKRFQDLRKLCGSITYRELNMGWREALAAVEAFENALDALDKILKLEWCHCADDGVNEGHDEKCGACIAGDFLKSIEQELSEL